MKQVVSAFVMAALVGLAVSAQADERQSHGYTNADINGGYGCNVSERSPALALWEPRSIIRRATGPSAKPFLHCT
jgi:predicted carbohydrate-binding protein with CBM5 and CBM33 domain